MFLYPLVVILAALKSLTFELFDSIFSVSISTSKSLKFSSSLSLFVK
ncbi:MAG: hypothetical protein CM15mP75_6840 [Flammeovirgaceae bacterium]|nr:MAG: hypothetical protein CM15mP75_6840 [Flammeovirgaceae bacterium]